MTNAYFEIAFEQMNRSFSSYEFTGLLRKIGVSEKIIGKSLHVEWLHKVANRESKNFWIKKQTELKQSVYQSMPLLYRGKYANELMSAFNEMNDTFTSFEFTPIARNKGVEESFIRTGGCSHFLKKVAYQNRKSGFNWTKKPAPPTLFASVNEPVKPIKTIEPVTEPVISESIKRPTMKEAECVFFLKSLGYKVLKPTTTFEEI